MAAKNSLPKTDQAFDADLAADFKVSRLIKRADFLNARNGARSHERAFVLQLVKRRDEKCADLRIGFTVTKKIGNAVVRNRIKRRLREAVRKAEFPDCVQGHDAVLIARADAQTQPLDALAKSIAHAFIEAKSSAKDKKIGKKSNDSVAKSTRKGQERTHNAGGS